MSSSIAPIQTHIDTLADGKNGQCLSWLESRGVFTKFHVEKGGFLKSHKQVFQPVSLSRAVVVNPLNGIVWIGALYEDQVRQSFPVLTREDGGFDRAAEIISWSYYDIDTFSPWETVNAHQWEGEQPIQRKGSTGTILETERAMWDVAAAANGERVILYRGHNSRDDVFRLNTLANEFFTYWRNLISMFRDEIKIHNPDGKAYVMQVEDEDNQDALGKIYNDMSDEYAENPPSWDRG